MVTDPDGEIFDQPPENETNPATPYFLVYVRDDRTSELVEAVARDPKIGLHQVEGQEDPKAAAPQTQIQLYDKPPDYSQQEPFIQGDTGPLTKIESLADEKEWTTVNHVRKKTNTEIEQATDGW